MANPRPIVKYETEYPPRVIVSMPSPLIAELDRWRYVNRVPSRAEAIRRLLSAALKTWPRGQRNE
jgi:metal-responsive CopG/Arc/MetJ family transcriptional regulator